MARCPSTTRSAARSARTPSPASAAPIRPAGDAAAPPLGVVERRGRSGDVRRPGRATGRPRRRRRRPRAPQATFTIPGAAPSAAIPGVRRRRGTSGFGCLVGLVILAAVVAGPVIAIVSFVGGRRRRDRRGDGRARRHDDDRRARRDRAEPTRRPRSASTGRSMVQPTNFGGALRPRERQGPRPRGQHPAVARPRLDADGQGQQAAAGVTVDYLGGLNLGRGGERGRRRRPRDRARRDRPSARPRGSCARRRSGTGARRDGINYLVAVARASAAATTGSPTSRTATTSRATRAAASSAGSADGEPPRVRVRRRARAASPRGRPASSRRSGA